jgi:glycosidase
MNVSYNEFHIGRTVREKCDFDSRLYASTGNVIFADLKAVRSFQTKLNEYFDSLGMSDKRVSAGDLNAMALIDEIFHFICALYRQKKDPNIFADAITELNRVYTKEEIDKTLFEFIAEFPPVAVYQGKQSAEDYLNQSLPEEPTGRIRTNREATLEEIALLHLANENLAFRPFGILFNDKKLIENPNYAKVWDTLKAFVKSKPFFGTFNHDLISMLKEPSDYSPTDLKGQLDYIRMHWGEYLSEWVKRRLLGGLDTITEEQKAAWHPITGGEVDVPVPSYDSLIKEYERFSPDREWMPCVILMAKTVLVWLDQLSKKYHREINTLDKIPNEELDTLRDEGFTGLWLIGLWERSAASKRIKQICGNPEAAASAYSLHEYEIAGNLGGWAALENLRGRCQARGLRLASDMVPNHTGMDSRWVIEKPQYFVQRWDSPFPGYSFNGENLSHDGRVGVYLEDHYYSKSDCAVVFKRVDNYTGETRYIYHGNDGTGMPWNDTAQIDFLNPEAREAVMQEILHVARNFPIIRFDAAMVLAKKHIRRLWYPEPGHGGDIATRSEYALSNEEFEARIPNEFWREVVDRIAKELPDTLLLAEAFWMLEGYFVRTLGMHRVYNSAFMNMLKKEENQKYRDTVKNTIKFDPQILKRYVNFMNNPDEETAVAQFGKGDKYFGVCTLMVTMPGLPMFGHGQIEGFEEKYGMEYTKAYRDEKPDGNLVARHWHDIFPLMKKRYIFANVENFLFYDVWDNGRVNENVFAYSNGVGNENAVVFYNNKYERATGWIKQSVPYAVKKGENDVEMRTRTLGEGLGLSYGADHFCVFREARSGMYYVRSSDDIINNGLFLSLNGFEAQVLMDAHQVVDGADGMYRTLCDFLNGRGTPDLKEAWEDIVYKDLYLALDKVLSQDFFDKVHVLFMSDVQRKECGFDEINFDEFIAEVEKPLRAFYETASNMQSGTKKEFVVEDALKLFRYATSYLYSEMQSAQSGEAKGSSFKAKLTKLIFKGLQANAYAPELLVSYSLIAPFGFELCKKYDFERKIAQAAMNSKVAFGDFRRILHNIVVLSEIRDFGFGAMQNRRSTFDAASIIADSADAFSLCGANEYDGVRWFNQERMNEALWYLLSANIMCKPNLSRANIYKLYTVLDAAKEGAAYRVDAFLDSVKPDEKDLPKRGKRVRSVSATEKKAEKKSSKKSVKKTEKSEKKPVEKKKTAKKPSKKTEKKEEK